MRFYSPTARIPAPGPATQIPRTHLRLPGVAGATLVLVLLTRIALRITPAEASRDTLTETLHLVSFPQRGGGEAARFDRGQIRERIGRLGQPLAIPMHKPIKPVYIRR